MSISGHATSEGTARYAERLADKTGAGHFVAAGELAVSSIGLGTYLGEPDDETDLLVTEAAVRAVRGGINLLDCAINYRFERAEKALGAALARLVDEGPVQRDELVVCSKAGFVPAKDCIEWFERTYVHEPSNEISRKDLVAGCHCMHPEYLRDQLERSLANLGLATVDVYYLHNPETQRGPLGEKKFYEHLGEAFAALEAARADGLLREYGLATWNAFRVPTDNPEHVDLTRAKEIARQAAPGGADGLKWIQLPLNLAMPEALLATQPGDGEAEPILEAARKLDMAVVTSASIMQGRLVGRLPPPMAAALGDGLTGDGQRALQFTRSCPGVTSALIGLKQPAHVDQALGLVQAPPLAPSAFLQVLGQQAE